MASAALTRLEEAVVTWEEGDPEVLHATGWDLIHSLLGLLRHDDSSSIYGAMILNSIAEHGHSREVYLAIMECLGAYRTEVARVQLIRMLSKVLPRLRSPLKFIPQCFMRLVQLLHEDPSSSGNDTDNDDDSYGGDSDIETAAAAGSADDHETQSAQRQRFVAGSAEAVRQAHVAVPPLVVLLQPLLQFIASFHKEVVDAVGRTQADRDALRGWVAGFLLSILGRPALAIDLNAPVAGQPLRQSLFIILGLLQEIGVTFTTLLQYRPPPPPPVRVRKQRTHHPAAAAAVQETDILESSNDEEEEESDDGQATAVSEMNGGVEMLDAFGTLRRVYTLADPFPWDGVAGALYLHLVEGYESTTTAAKATATTATTPLQLFLGTAWAMATLLRGPESEVAMKGFRLAEKVLEGVKDPAVTLHDVKSNFVYELCQALINVAVSVNHDVIRKQLFAKVMAVLDVSVEAARFALLLQLMRGCPYGPVLALLLNRVKTEIMKFWWSPATAATETSAAAAAAAAAGAAAAAESAPGAQPTATVSADAPQQPAAVQLNGERFATPAVLGFVLLGLQHDDVVPYIDVLTAAINLLRFLLIRDKENITGVRTNSELRGTLDTLRRNIDGALGEIQSQLAVCDAAPEQDSAVQHRRQLLQRNAGLVTVLLDLLGMTTELLGAAA